MKTRLPYHKYSTYIRYLNESDVLITWLAATARSTGTVEELFRKGPGLGCLKGKARKNKPEPVAGAAKEHVLSANSLVVLAKAVANCKRCKVPKHMMGLLQNIIRERKEVGTYYERKGDSDDGHPAFIAIMEEVQEILTTRCPKRFDKLRNIFEYLEVEEPTECTTITTQIPAMKKSVVTHTYKLEKSKQDMDVALHCFLKDATSIRLFVRRTWRKFHRGRISLETAALSASSAIALICRLNEELVQEYPVFEKHSYVCAVLLEGAFRKADNKLAVGVEAKFENAYTDGIQTLSLPTVLCLHTEELLYLYVLKIRDHRLDKLTPAERLLIICLIQAKFLASAKLAAVDQESTWLLQRDSVIKAISEIDTTGKIRSWAVFAVQIFWDTQLELDKDIGKGLSSAQTNAIWIQEYLKEFLSVETADKPGTELAQKIQKAVQVWFADGHCHIQDLLERMGGKTYAHGENFLLLHHPAFCGLLSQEFIRMTHISATASAGAQRMILNAAHFYNAMKQAHIIAPNTHWKDMEFVIEKQGEEHMFVGKRPMAPRDFQIRRNLAFGWSIQMYAKEHKSGRQGHTKRIPKRGTGRELQYMSEYMRVSVEKTGKGQVRPSRAGTDGAVLIECMLRDHFSSSQNSKGTSVDILEALRDALELDQLPMAFDVYRLHLGCRRLLTQIQSQILCQAPTDYGDPWYQGTNECVAGLFMELEGFPIHDAPQIPEAANTLQRFIMEEGASQHEAALNRVGHFSRTRIPTIDYEPKEPSWECPESDRMSFLMRTTKYEDIPAWRHIFIRSQRLAKRI